MELARLLFSQGFGSRRECTALCLGGHVSIAGEVCEDPQAEVTPEGLVFQVDGQPWTYRARALLMLHKPLDFECSRTPSHHRSVLDLLPAPLRRRGVQPVGRLDADTSGLLLLTDDGALIHRLTSPRQHVPKVYEVTVKHALQPAQVEALRTGVVLRDDPTPVRAAALTQTGAQQLQLTLTEGRYHQVKRMVAAAGNRVEALHRSGFGNLTLGELQAGQWRWLDGETPWAD